MNETFDVDQPAASQQPASMRANLPRLRLPLISLAVYWALTFAAGAVDKPYFFGFLFGLLTTGILTLILLGWWWFNRRIRFHDKVLGFAFLVGEAVVVGKLSDRSVSFFTLWVLGFPLVSTLAIVWLILVKRLGISSPRLGSAVIVTLAWAGFLTFRIDGADSRLKFKTHWRWTPTAEEQFLAKALQTPTRTNLANTNTPGRLESVAGDWTSFRGPERDGVIRGTSIATNWEANPPTPIWKHDVGPAWSSLLVVGNRVYTQEQRGEKETVVCYDAASGGQVWLHADLCRFDEQVSGPGPRATPTLANGRLYTLGGTGLLSCLDAATGASLWQRDIKVPSGAKAPTWAFASSPLVTGDLVMVYAGGEAGKGLLAYHAESGESAWSAPAGTSSYSSPQLTSICGVPQCLMLHDSGLTSVDIGTGQKLWETGMVMKGAPKTGQPRLIQGNQLLVATLGGLGCSLIEVSKNGSQWVISNKWDSRSLKPEFPDFVVHKGYVYGFDVGIFCCINAADGKRCWKEGRYGRGQVMLLADQDLLLVSTETGELVLLAADPGAHKELGRFQALEGKTWNHPVVKGNRVYLRNAQEMACYSLASKAAGLAARQ